MKKINYVFLLGLLILLSTCSPEKDSETSIAESSLVESHEISKVTTTSDTAKEKESMMQIESGELIKAVNKNDLEQVQKILLDKTYDINETNDNDETPLLIATHNNQVEIAKELILAGADVNQQDSIQDSPYLYAGAQGKTEILSLILENSEPDQKVYNRFGGNTIIPAAEKGYLDNVKLLLEDGKVDIDHQNNFGYTALIEAVALTDGSQLYLEIVKELLDHGADRTLRDSSGKNAADYARQLGYHEILKELEN